MAVSFVSSSSSLLSSSSSPSHTSRFCISISCISIIIFSCLLFVSSHSTSSSTVTFGGCVDRSIPDQHTPAALTIIDSHQEDVVTWSTKDVHASTSVVQYRLCGQRSLDLRFITHMRLSHWVFDQQVMDLQMAICAETDQQRQACLNQLQQSNFACLTGSVVVRTPVLIGSLNGRSEILITEGKDQVVKRLCSQP